MEGEIIVGRVACAMDVLWGVIRHARKDTPLFQSADAKALAHRHGRPCQQHLSENEAQAQQCGRPVAWVMVPQRPLVARGLAFPPGSDCFNVGQGRFRVRPFLGKGRIVAARARIYGVNANLQRQRHTVAQNDRLLLCESG